MGASRLASFLSRRKQRAVWRQEVLMSKRITVVVGCVAVFATVGPQLREVGHAAAVRPAQIATIMTLPSFGRGGSAMAIDEAGTFIAGQASDKSGLPHAVEWTPQADGSWAIHDLPWPPGATRTFARGVNNRGDVAGDDLPVNLFPSHALLWLAGTSAPLILNCPTDLDGAVVYAISANAQVVVGNGLLRGSSTAAVWRPGVCREDLPLPGEGPAAAHAVNADGTIAGGQASVGGTSGIPVRWRKIADEWRFEQLDTRNGEADGANGAGDLAGYVMTQCGSSLCQRAIVWYADGTAPTELGTLGGQDSFSLALDINSSGEVVGMSRARRGNTNAAFFWSPPDPLVGMVQLPAIRRSARANALSDVRPDRTRLVVGVSDAEPVIWVVRNP
jgi:uncharacterized membrane protein